MARTEAQTRDGLLWLGTLGPPVINLLQLTFNFAVARHACKAHTMLPMWIGSAVAIVITVAICIIAWGAAREPLRTHVTVEHFRTRLLAYTAVGAGGFGLLLTIALSLPAVFMNPCD